jgi:hypothetical protein
LRIEYLKLSPPPPQNLVRGFTLAHHYIIKSLNQFSHFPACLSLRLSLAALSRQARLLKASQ